MKEIRKIKRKKREWNTRKNKFSSITTSAHHAKVSFIKNLISIINTQGYVNLSKEIAKAFPAITSLADKIYLIRKFTYTLVGTGDYVREDVSDGRLLFKSEEHYINKRIEATNSSVIETNANIRITNNSIRSLNKFQKWTLGASVVVAVLTTVFIILTYLEQRNDTSQTQLKALKTEGEKQSKALQDINSSIEKLKSDSITVRLKK